MDPDTVKKPQESAEEAEIVMTKPKIAKPHPFKYLFFHLLSKKH
jgi:hypothetical protein